MALHSEVEPRAGCRGEMRMQKSQSCLCAVGELWGLVEGPVYSRHRHRLPCFLVCRDSQPDSYLEAGGALGDRGEGRTS